MLQYVTQLINIVWNHILFDHEVFKTELLLKYKETMGTFCSTSVNPLYQSLKSLLPEISIQITISHSDVNDHQNISIDFLSSNFFQTNDNVVTVKNDVSRTTTVSYMHFLNYFSRFEIGSNSLEPLLYESINPSDQVVNALKFVKHDQ